MRNLIKFYVFLALLISGGWTQATEINGLAFCSKAYPAEKMAVIATFTEPFISIHIDTTKQVACLTDFDGPSLLRINKIEKDLSGTVTLYYLSNLQALSIDTSTTGSDGMSDFEYPYEAILYKVDRDGNLQPWWFGYQDLFGGAYDTNNPPYELPY